jgi:Ras-related protein Rab-5C
LVSDLPAKSPVEAITPEEVPESTETTSETDDEADTETAPAPTSSSDSDDPRQVSHAEAEQYAKESSLLFFEASAKVS